MFCHNGGWPGLDIVNRFVGYVVQAVAGVCERSWVDPYDDYSEFEFEYQGRRWRRHDVTAPLPNELPAEITPELALRLLPELLHALDRNEELLALLWRRSQED